MTIKYFLFERSYLASRIKTIGIPHWRFRYVYSITINCSDLNENCAKASLGSLVEERTELNPILFDFWKRSHCPSFVDRTLLATLTTYTSHSVRPPKSYLLSPLGQDDPPYGPSFAAVCKYEEREGSSSLGRPTAVHRIVFRRHLSSRSGITLPRWYTMTFISGFVRLGPWSFLSCQGSCVDARPFVETHAFAHQSHVRAITVRKGAFFFTKRLLAL